MSATTVLLGSTGIKTPKNAFGALPIQRVGRDEASLILRRAYDSGITFYDTALSYSDSEEKLGYALSDVRKNIFIATKTPSITVEGFWSDLETSLTRLKTDYIDIYQFHNPAFCPRPGDEAGIYDAMLEAKKQGKIRHIGITNHRLSIAREAIESGLYETLQFPFCYLSGEPDIELVQLCAEKNVGFIAMKSLSGGLITSAAAAYAFSLQYDNVLPIWGIQKMDELEEFLAFDTAPPVMDATLSAIIEADRKELVSEFCRGCGYCMPCPVGIEVSLSARMGLMLRRSPPEQWLTAEWQKNMHKIKDCLHCGQCSSHCPYGLDTPALLAKNYEDYLTFLPQ